MADVVVGFFLRSRFPAVWPKDTPWQPCLSTSSVSTPSATPGAVVATLSATKGRPHGQCQWNSGGIGTRQVDRARSFVVSRKGEQPSISQVQAPCGSSYSPPLPWTLGFFLARILPWRHHLRTEDSARSKSLVISVVEYDVRRSTSRSISRHRRSESTCPGACRCRDHCQWRLSHSLTCPIFEVSGCTKGEISRTDRKSCWKRASDQLSVVKRSTRLDKMRTMRTI